MIPLHDDNPTRTKPVLTVLLIAANVLVFMYQLSLGPRQEQALVFQFGAIPAVIVGTRSLPDQLAAIPPFFSLFTSMFLHGGFLHIIGNMLYLWIFGNNIEDAMGRVRFLVFYLTCGVLAALAHILSNPASVIPTIGASGAISGRAGSLPAPVPACTSIDAHPVGIFHAPHVHSGRYCVGFLVRFPVDKRQPEQPSGVASPGLLTWADLWRE